MKITDVKIYPVKNSYSTLKAFANITIDDEFVVKGLKIVEGKKGVFLVMPSSKGADDQYYDDVFPITADCRDYLNTMVLGAYEDSNTKPARAKSKR